MTNPDNAVGTNAAYSGRTSPNAFNDVLALFASRGILKGWNCNPDSGLTVVLGGISGTRDVAIAMDNNGNRVTINNISQAPVPVTLAPAPANNSRIDSIVAYVDNPPQGDENDRDNPSAVGIIAVQGTIASSPTPPTDSAIRTAITADGASGATAYYVVLANITLASGTTNITSSLIQQNRASALLDVFYPVGSIYMSATLSTPAQVAAALGGTWVAWGSGRVPIGVNTSDTDFNTVEKTGGSKTNTHNHYTESSYDGNVLFVGQMLTPRTRIVSYRRAQFNPAGAADVGPMREDSTYDEAISIVQPYITCYMYKRTA